MMAAGKSTVAQALAETLPRAAHVRGDLFRRMIVSGREEYLPRAGDEARAQLLLRHRLSAATADAYAEAGFTAVVQDVVLGEDLRTYTGLVRTRPLYVVVLAPRAEAVAAREVERTETGYGAAWTVGMLDEALRADAAHRTVAGHIGADGGADRGGDSGGEATREGALSVL